MLIIKTKVCRPILLIASLVGFALYGSGFSYGQNNLAPGQEPRRDVVQQESASGASNALNEPTDFVPPVVDVPGGLIGAGTRSLAGKRVALVIGNSQYETVAALDNPRNDAKAIADVLREIGFEDVKLVENLDYSGMRRTLKEFATNAVGSEVAVIYYAGHGVEVGGTNYLVPTDAELLRAQDVDFEGIPLDNVRSAVSGAAKLRLVILDACRNNPFKLASSNGKRSIGRGLARVEGGANELIAYAAREGTLASDGTGRGNSPYAAALIRHMRTPGLEINFLFRKVRDDVLSATSNEQEPYVYGSLGGEAIYLNRQKGAGPEVANVSPHLSSFDRETVFWNSIKDSQEPADFKAYLERYPEGGFARLAEIRLAALDADFAPATEMAELLPAEIEGATKRDSDAPQPFDRSQLARLDPEAAVAAEKSASGELPPAELEAALGLESDDYKRIQVALNTLGYEVGAEDGAFGSKSREGLRKFQIHSRIENTGYLTESTLISLLQKFEETPKTYEGEWEIGFHRYAYGPDPGGVNDRTLLMLAKIKYRDGAFYVLDESVYSSDKTLFDTFVVSIADDGTFTIETVIDYIFRGDKERRVRFSGKLPRFVAVGRTFEIKGPLLERGDGNSSAIWAKLELRRLE